MKLTPDNIQISKGGLAATVLGSIIGTSLIALGVGYWFIHLSRSCIKCIYNNIYLFIKVCIFVLLYIYCMYKYY